MAVHHLHGFEATRTVELGARDSSKSKSSASSSSTCNNSNTGVCEKPESTNRLAIGLGVGIPIACALIVILILHYRHLRKLKKEELENQHIDVDMDDYDNMAYRDDSEKGSNNGSNDRAVDDQESQIGSLRGSTRGSTRAVSMAPPSLRGPSPFEPYYANAPYLPTVHDTDSKVSLEEYSKSIIGVSEQVYPSNASVYSAAASPRMPPPLHHKPGTGSMYSLGRIGSSPSVNSGLSQSAYTRHSSIDRQDSPFGDHNKLPETVVEGDSVSVDSAHTAEADFDFHNNNDNSANHDKFVLDDDQDDDTNSQAGTHEHEPVELHRNDTKHFERVKSVYKEYMDGNVDDDEEDDHQRTANRASQVPSVPVPAVPTVPDEVQESKAEAQPQAPQAEAKPQTQPAQSELKVPELESDNGTPQSTSSPPESTTFYTSSPPETKPVYENAHENEYPHEIDDARSSVYSARPLDDTASFMGSVRTGHHHPHLPPEAYNMYNYAPPTPVGYGPGSDGRPGSATSSQNSSKPAIPLPKLTTLPTPHSLSETENPLSYAPQRRVKTGGPASPKYSPSYSVLNRSHTGEVLPSPHALRSSVVLTSNLEYAPPKKYQANSRMRSNSLTSSTLPSSGSAYEMPPTAPGSGHSTPRLGSGFSTSLVPDARNDGDLLRPTMDMR